MFLPDRQATTHDPGAERLLEGMSRKAMARAILPVNACFEFKH
jgi:hypothetical protein